MANIAGPPVARRILSELRAAADPERARQMARYFRTGKGEYGEGDRFLGIPVPGQRALAKRHVREAGPDDVMALLASQYHEARLTGLFLLVHFFEAAEREGKAKAWVDLYVSHTHRMNNWDLVDSGAYKILGQWLIHRDRSVLYRLAESDNLWDNRIAMIATLAFIRRGEVADTLRLAERFLTHPHDLMHKAAGWMLREAWVRQTAVVEEFLRRYQERMPRTMLRYAIEKIPAASRKAFLRKH
ncbi:MAG: DNA alkylation repair protein [Chitinophagia bacterium]|nr:DNA alkylation repair protein [Chitinophagia bacterium]